MPTRQDKGRTNLSVDFSNVQEGGGGSRSVDVPDGDYLFELVSATVHENQAKDGEHVRFLWKIVKGQQVPAKGGIYDRASLKEEALWKLRNILGDLLGKEIPKRALNLDLAKYVGKQIGGSTVHGEGKYKDRSEIDAYFPASDFNDAGSDDAEELGDDDLSTGDDDTDELETVDDDDL